MTARIRWEGPDSSGTLTGHVGTLKVYLFRIYPTAGKDWRLDCELPGWDGVPGYSDTPEKLQGRAETWLGEFAASLGVVFLDDITALATIEEEGRPAAFFDEHDLAAINAPETSAPVAADSKE